MLCGRSCRALVTRLRRGISLVPASQEHEKCYGIATAHQVSRTAIGKPIWQAGPHVPAAAWSIAATLRAIGEAWREGLAAHREYERLRSRGMAHDTALREALGIGRVSSPAPRNAAKPLCFAGKA